MLRCVRRESNAPPAETRAGQAHLTEANRWRRRVSPRLGHGVTPKLHAFCSKSDVMMVTGRKRMDFTARGTYGTLGRKLLGHPCPSLFTAERQCPPRAVISGRIPEWTRQCPIRSYQHEWVESGRLFFRRSSSREWLRSHHLSRPVQAEMVSRLCRSAPPFVHRSGATITERNSGSGIKLRA